MDTGVSTAGSAAPAKSLKLHAQAQLHTAVSKIMGGLSSGANMGIARHHQLGVFAGQLCALAAELGAGDAVIAQATEIKDAISRRAIDTARVACSGFEHALDAASEGAPMARSPAPVIPASAAPANDNGGSADPERAQDDPEREQIAPERDQEAATSDTGEQEPKPALIVEAVQIEGAAPLPPIALPTPANDVVPANDVATPIVASVPAGQIASVGELGELLRQARSRRQLSQQDVATAAGVGRRFIVELEAGKATSQIGCVLAVCAALGVSIAASAA